MGYVDDVMDLVQKHIPKTPEESLAKSQENPVNQRFNDYAIGNFFERIHGFNGGETLYSGHVVTKGGSDKVTSDSYLGVIAQFFRAVYRYGDDSAKDGDPIYNGREGKSDITTGGNSIPSLNSLEGSVLYTRIENIFDYFSTKTTWMLEQTDGVKGLFNKLDQQFRQFINQSQQSNNQQQQTNNNTSASLTQMQQDIKDIGDKVKKLEQDVQANGGDIGNLRKDFSQFRSTTNARLNAIEQKLP